MDTGNIAESIVDIVIIGGGPTGLFAAYYAGLRHMSVKIIDSLEVLGGQLTTLYPEKYIYDVAGFVKVLAKDLSRNLVEQAMQYDPTICLGEQVLELTVDHPDALKPTYKVITTQGVHHGRSILIAAGLGSFQPKTLTLPDIEKYKDRGLHYFVKGLEPFIEKRVLIVGGGDSAVDWANMLEPIAREVTLIHRRDQFRAHEDSVRKMKLSSVNILLFKELKSIGGAAKVESAVVYDNRTKQDQILTVDHILVNVGFVSTLGPVEHWGLQLEGHSIKVDSMMHTNRPGIFAAGDVATYPGKLKLIATGFAEACTAVNFAKTYIDPSARAFPGHSSEMPH
jgi:ferredoxin/flavodoxin---NADP+ reductase